MSKLRFTDTEKWRDAWFQGLTLEAKLIWLYLVDNCDNAGVWKVNEREASFHLGFSVTVEKILASLGSRVETLTTEKILMPKFVSFQCPSGLSVKSAPHRQILRTLELHGLVLDYPFVRKNNRVESSVHGRVLCTLKEEDKEEDKEKDKETRLREFFEHHGAITRRSNGEDLLPQWRKVTKGLKQPVVEEIFRDAKPAIEWPSEFKQHRAARSHY